jgi:prephenate dehydratase
MDLSAIRVVASFPHATEQCERFLRERLPQARVAAASSTAEAVRLVMEGAGPDAAIGTPAAAERYGATVLERGIEDVHGNATRFVWLAPRGGAAKDGAGPEIAAGERWTTALVFWGRGDETPGWLVRCLSEFAFRGVNLTRIESRPRKQALGHYVFFLDCDGAEDDRDVAAAIEALAGQAERVRVLGTWPKSRLPGG